MTLKELITMLEAADPSHVAPVGFHNPHSYRGYYEDLAFSPLENVPVSSMLACARGALGATYQGYKGGDYTMGDHTEVWLAEYGRLGEGIGPVLLSYMIGSPGLGREATP